MAASPERAWLSNARMYAVTPAVEQGWRALLARVAEEAGVRLDYFPYAAPQPLEQLWSRRDLGCVFMCGYPIATQLAAVAPIVAPIPKAPWAGGRAVYRSDLIVRADAPFETLADTFGHRAGFTVAHSQSGFNAFRHHLLRYRSAAFPKLYAQMQGDLITARNVLESVRSGRIDVGPLDAYWHALLAHADPAATSGIRVLESTALTPIPALVAGGSAPPDLVERLRAAFVAAPSRPWFRDYSGLLQLAGFEPVSTGSYDVMLDWEREAVAAGYAQPA